MRTEGEIKNLIVHFAANDERIRTVLLNGSRANPNIEPDKLQDFDILFIVKNFESFVRDHSWTNFLGDKLIWQLPDEMGYVGEVNKIGFSYLMILKDGNRIDLTIFPIEQVVANYREDSLTVVWLDKDGLFPKEKNPSDKNYYVSRPTEKEFLETCNEFWWVSTYVAKGLLRNEIIYAKEMLETVVRLIFMKIIAWKIGSENSFSVSIGKAGKYVNRYLAASDFNKLMATYSDRNIEDNWKSLFIMIDLFGQFAEELSIKLKFTYNKEEQMNTLKYLMKQYIERENYHQ